MTLRPDQRESLARLLADLDVYRSADPARRQAIGERMFYDDPMIWIAYKREAYRGTPQEIATVGDFRRHAEHPGDLCEKRYRFLRTRLPAWPWSDDMPLERLAEDPTVLALSVDPGVLSQWRAHEYFRDGERVAKWESYP